MQPLILETMPVRTIQGVVRARTLLTIRWIAIAGQAISLAVVTQILKFDLPLLDCVAILLAAVLANLIVIFTKSPRAWLSAREAGVQLIFDVFQLGALLFLTGGLQNPFALLILAPVIVAATLLSLRATALMALGVMGVAIFLSRAHRPLPWPDAGFQLPELYVLGLLVALLLAAVFFATYGFRVAQEARAMAAALAAAQMELSREQKAAALGALAAAAAHELGSPLGTIAVVAREMAHDVPKGGALAEDLDLIQSEIRRCRDILAELSREPDHETAGVDPFDKPLLSALLREIAEPYIEPDIDLIITPIARDATPEPLIRRRAELMRGIGLIVQNAFQFAQTRVTLTLVWDQRDVTLTVQDDGPGYPAPILARLGDPYVSGRGADKAGHMGLGTFIAQTLLVHTGARVSFDNASAGASAGPDGAPGGGAGAGVGAGVGVGGAKVSLAWKRSRLESEDTVEFGYAA